ncbi:MAG: helix-turn-helix transcriptional regulator [Prevotella sp.]|nr:helix-turn-helix transcriptional regulator [Prevotella sp.]
MKDRIRQIMESQNMTQQLFADYIGQSPATLSSIFNGRTRPTLNIVEAIKKKIPNISTDWLMFGSGEMYLPDQTSENGSQEMADQGPDGTSMPQNLTLDFESSPVSTPKNGSSAISNYNSVRNTHPEIDRTGVKFIDKPQRRVKEIRVFYDDQTWETFVPEKK